MTQRIDPFFSLWLSKWNFFWSTNTTHRTDFFQYYSQNWTSSFCLNMTFFLFDIEIFFLIRLKELKFSNTTQRIQLFSLIWLKVLNFFVWLSELNFFWLWLKESNPFFECDFFQKKKKKQKIELFSKKMDSNNWTFLNMTQWIEPSLNDSKNWTFFEYGSKIRTFFFEYESMNRTHFYVSQKLKFLVEKVKKWKFSLFFLKTQNWFFFTWLEELNPPFSTWLRELIFFFLNLLKVFSMDSKNRTLFLIRLNESNPFFKCDFFQWFKELNLFLGKITQRIGLILMIPRLEASFLNYDTNFFWKKKKLLKELDQIFWLKCFFLYGSKKCFYCTTQRIDFIVWLKELIFLFDSKN